MRQPVMKGNQLAVARDDMSALGNPDTIHQAAISRQIVPHAHRRARRQWRQAAEFQGDAGSGRYGADSCERRLRGAQGPGP